MYLLGQQILKNPLNFTFQLPQCKMQLHGNCWVATWVSFKQKASCSHRAHLLDQWNVNVYFEGASNSFAMVSAPTPSERQMLE